MNNLQFRLNYQLTLKKNLGFSLVEMAIVLIIFGFILTAILLPLRTQREQLAQTQTELALETAKKALLGFAQSQARLPCPATATSNGAEAPLGGGACTQQDGFLPAATLGIQPTDSQGYAIDAWNNRIRYAVTMSNSSAFTTVGNIATFDIASLTPDLRVCNTSTGITASACSVTTPESNYLITNAVVTLYSLGATGNQASGGNDENANLNANSVFVSHGITASGATNGEFDHIVTWISPYLLYNAMIEAGQLH